MRTKDSGNSALSLSRVRFTRLAANCARTFAGPPARKALDDGRQIEPAAFKIVTRAFNHVAGFVGAGISASARFISAIDPNGSAVPWTKTDGVRKFGRCCVRNCSGLPGGCSG